jgi:predicted phosphoribosyltransferase
MPEPFGSVGAWYADFHQTTDMEVQQLLAQNRRQMGPILKTVSFEEKHAPLR